MVSGDGNQFITEDSIVFLEKDAYLYNALQKSCVYATVIKLIEINK